MASIGLSPPFLVAVSLIVIALILVPLTRFLLSTLRPADFPPGPTPLAGLGNLHQLPVSRSFLTFSVWAKSTYGSIIGLKIGPTNLVVLHHAAHVRRLLLQDRGAALNARPRLPVAADHIFPGDDNHPLWSDAAHHARMRRALAYHTSATGVGEAAPLLHAFAGRLANDLLLLDSTNGDFNTAFHTWAYDMALAVLFGRSTRDMGDAWMDAYRETHRLFVELIEPGVAQLAVIFPVVGWLPDALAGGWKRDAAAVRQGFNTTWAGLVSEVKDRPSTGARFESLFARYYRENGNESEKTEKKVSKEKEVRLSERETALVAGSTLDAAASTTLSTVLFLLQALAAHPQAQRRAQAEIDGAWGREKIPSSREMDLDALPYVSACVLETLRWRPPLPLSVPRMCLTDQTVVDDANGRHYRIPAGTTVVTNVWAIQHDPDEYDRPEAFEPERFVRNPLGTKFNPADENDTKRPPLQAFGVGRRACPGEDLALHSLRVTAALLLWAFEIVADGEMDCSPETGMLEGIAVTPKPFRVWFVPRDEKARQAVLDEYQRANQLLAEKLG